MYVIRISEKYRTPVYLGHDLDVDTPQPGDPRHARKFSHPTDAYCLIEAIPGLRERVKLGCVAVVPFLGGEGSGEAQ